MPKGPNGEKRPADAIGVAVMIGKIATGEIEDDRQSVKAAAAALGSMGGRKRAENMIPERRAEIAKKAAVARWRVTAAITAPRAITPDWKHPPRDVHPLPRKPLEPIRTPAVPATPTE